MKRARSLCAFPLRTGPRLGRNQTDWKGERSKQAKPTILRAARRASLSTYLYACKRSGRTAPTIHQLGRHKLGSTQMKAAITGVKHHIGDKNKRSFVRAARGKQSEAGGKGQRNGRSFKGHVTFNSWDRAGKYPFLT